MGIPRPPRRVLGQATEGLTARVVRARDVTNYGIVRYRELASVRWSPHPLCSGSLAAIAEVVGCTSRGHVKLVVARSILG